MNLHNYKKANDYDVIEWLERAIVEITPYQKQKLRDNETIRFAPFKFMESRKKVNNVWLRFTVIFLPIVWILLVMSMPFVYFFTGQWGYRYDSIKWYDKWYSSVCP